MHCKGHLAEALASIPPSSVRKVHAVLLVDRDVLVGCKVGLLRGRINKLDGGSMGSMKPTSGMDEANKWPVIVSQLTSSREMSLISTSS